jgi:hypothetical protein
MNETVLAEFLFEEEMADKCEQFISSLGDDFKHIKTEIEWDFEIPSARNQYRRISGSLSGERALVIKLGDPFYADRLQVYSVPTELKDKYRTSR